LYLCFFSQSIYTHVKDILPNFKFTTHIRTDNGNIRDLLSHTMGFPSNNMMRLDPKLTRNDIARYLCLMLFIFFNEDQHLSTSKLKIYSKDSRVYICYKYTGPQKKRHIN
jgi:hypothetical protein